jgi:hypothetical protein
MCRHGSNPLVRDAYGKSALAHANEISHAIVRSQMLDLLRQFCDESEQVEEEDEMMALEELMQSHSLEVGVFFNIVLS